MNPTGIAICYEKVSVNGPLSSKNNIVLSQDVNAQPICRSLRHKFNLVGPKFAIADVPNIDHRDPFCRIVTGLELSSERSGLDAGCTILLKLADG